MCQKLRQSSILYTSIAAVDCWSHDNIIALALAYMELQVLQLLLIALGICTSSSRATSGDQPVYFTLVVSSAPMFNTSEIVSGVDQALELVLKTDILPGYHLQYAQVFGHSGMCIIYNS